MVDFLAMIFAMPNALFPAMSISFGGAQALGLLYAAPALGALILSFLSRWTVSIMQDRKAIALAAMLWGSAIIGFGLAHSLWPALFFLILAGAFDSASGIFRVSLWNNIIPTEYRGRLAGIEMLSYLSGPRLGDVRAGLVASSLGMTTAIVSGGVLCIISIVLCCTLMPKFWNYESTKKPATT